MLINKLTGVVLTYLTLRNGLWIYVPLEIDVHQNTLDRTRHRGINYTNREKVRCNQNKPDCHLELLKWHASIDPATGHTVEGLAFEFNLDKLRKSRLNRLLKASFSFNVESVSSSSSSISSPRSFLDIFPRDVVFAPVRPDSAISRKTRHQAFLDETDEEAKTMTSFRGDRISRDKRLATRLGSVLDIKACEDTFPRLELLLLPSKCNPNGFASDSRILQVTSSTTRFGGAGPGMDEYTGDGVALVLRVVPTTAGVGVMAHHFPS